MAQHLQDLIEAANRREIAVLFEKNYLYKKERIEELRSIQDETESAINIMLEIANEAICFDAGDIGSFEGLKINYDVVKLPFPTTWVEMKINNYTHGYLMQEEHGFIAVQVWKKTQQAWVYLSSFVRENSTNEIVANNKQEKRLKEITLKTDKSPAGIYFSTVAAFLSVLNCCNVAKKEINPPEKVQKKRQKKGKQPIWSYWVLELKPTSRSGEAQGGTHASPRVHLRRGHVREYRPGEYTWVQPCVVGQGNGIVHKDYKLVA